MIRIPEYSRGLSRISKTDSPSNVSPNEIILLANNKLIYVDESGSFIEVKNRYYDPWHAGYMGKSFESDESGSPLGKLNFSDLSMGLNTIWMDPTFNYWGSGGFSSSSNGYKMFGSGGNGDHSSLHRLDFSNDTNGMTVVATASNEKRSVNATQSTLRGYVSGGYSNGYKSNISMIELSSESISEFYASLSENRVFPGSVSSSLAGYVMSGYRSQDNGQYFRSQNQHKFYFNNDSSIITISDTNFQSQVELDLIFSSLAGYSVGCKFSSGYGTTIYKWVFSTDTSAAISNKLRIPEGRTYGTSSSLAGFSGTSLYIEDGTGKNDLMARRLTYSTETIAFDLFEIDRATWATHSFESTYWFLSNFSFS